MATRSRYGGPRMPLRDVPTRAWSARDNLPLHDGASSIMKVSRITSPTSSSPQGPPPDYHIAVASSNSGGGFVQQQHTSSRGYVSLVDASAGSQYGAYPTVSPPSLPSVESSCISMHRSDSFSRPDDSVESSICSDEPIQCPMDVPAPLMMGDEGLLLVQHDPYDFDAFATAPHAHCGWHVPASLSSAALEAELAKALAMLSPEELASLVQATALPPATAVATAPATTGMLWSQEDEYIITPQSHQQQQQQVCDPIVVVGQPTPTKGGSSGRRSSASVTNTAAAPGIAKPQPRAKAPQTKRGAASRKEDDGQRWTASRALPPHATSAAPVSQPAAPLSMAVLTTASSVPASSAASSAVVTPVTPDRRISRVYHNGRPVPVALLECGTTVPLPSSSSWMSQLTGASSSSPSTSL